MSNGTDQRIRHVAIVLQSLDAGTSRRLLAQLPPAQSKSIRQAMVHLGTVSPQDRNAAFESMKGLLASLDAAAKPTSDRNHRTFSDHSVDLDSPASELLAASQQRGLDAIELSRDAAFTPVSTSSSENQERPLPSWHFMPDETLADILQAERPIVIATVLNQVSIERATALIQLLPLQVAGATLAAVPHLGLTDAAILRDIELELERKLTKYEPQQQMSNEGLSRLQAIMNRMPETQKNIWMNAVAQSNAVLATKLGWHRPLTSVPQLSGDMPDRLVQDQHSVDDLFERPRVIPFPFVDDIPAVSQLKAKDASITQVTLQEQKDAPKSHKHPRRSPLDALTSLSDRDFVNVLHACPAHSVLLAISGAPKDFVVRVERLVPPKDVVRLRSKLTQLGPTSLLEVDAAQELIADTADRLLAIGKIGALENVTFTAAA